MKLGTPFCAILLSAGIAAAGVTVNSMPPSVVKTVPQAGDTNVDPSLKEIRATFSKDMMTENMWSWCYDSPETFPEIDKTKIRYLADKRTCVLPVTLKPDTTYVIWINSQKFNSFRDTSGHPAVPYQLVFKTAAKASPSHAKAEKAAVRAAASWMKLIDSGQYEAAWNNGAAFLKSAVPSAQLSQALQVAREPLGEKLSRKVKSKTYMTSMPGMPDGEYVVIECISSFENKKQAVETITPMLEKDGTWRVSGYYIK